MKKTPLIYLLVAITIALMYVINVLAPGRHTSLLDLAFMVITLGGLLVIYLSGSLKRSWINIPVIIGIVIILTGVVFRIQLWPASAIIFFSGVTVTGIFYLLHFILKPVKLLLDYLKVSWMILRLASIGLVFINGPYSMILTHISNLLLLAIICLYLYQDHDNSLLAKKHS